MKTTLNTKNVLISVYDKSYITNFASELIKRNFNLFSTGGTAKQLIKSGIKVTQISKITDFPEIMNGCVKTLHPKIYAGILRQPYIDDQLLLDYDVTPFDIVVVNFYPFKKMLTSKKYSLDRMLQYIDIGGPSIVRAGIKNYANVVVVIDPSDYVTIINDIDLKKITIKKKFNLSIKALAYVSSYDIDILNYFSTYKKNKNVIFPKSLTLNYIKKQELSYGENKHQQSSFYTEITLVKGSVSSARQIQGKNLSFNNILDADTALECVKIFKNPTCVIVKHGNPCGVSTKNSVFQAYKSAYASDPISAFGGVIAFNRPLDEITAYEMISNQFVEVIVTPLLTTKTNRILQKKADLRVLIIDDLNDKVNESNFKYVNGGLLLQESDKNIFDTKQWKVVSLRKPSNLELKDAIFCWKVVKFVKSNAIVYSKNTTTVAIGAGQMSRIDSTIIANIKAKQQSKEVKGSVLASDAFLPFRDSVDKSAELGIACIIQPGGSIRDREIIDAANEHNISMIFTSIRHFRH